MEAQIEGELKELDNNARRDVATIGADSREKIAKLQDDTKRDIHDAAQQGDMVHKIADYHINKDNNEKEMQNDKGSGSVSTNKSDLDRAKEKI